MYNKQIKNFLLFICTKKHSSAQSSLSFHARKKDQKYKEKQSLESTTTTDGSSLNETIILKKKKSTEIMVNEFRKEVVNI